MFQLGVLGALLLAIIIFCAKFMRRGYTSLDENRKKYLERIELDERQLHEDIKRMASCEHLHIMRAAVEDLIRLENDRTGYIMECDGNGVTLGTPQGKWRVELIMREKKLRSLHRTLHGQSRWRLTGPGVHEEHAELANLMGALNASLHAFSSEPAEPEHFVRRFANSPTRIRPRGAHGRP